MASVVLIPEAAEKYLATAVAKGQAVEVLDVQQGGHFDIIAPGSQAWEQQVKPLLVRALNAAR